ncbi:hypothetical protein T4D_6869 [Trichinella pseudospiralis]|uniref:Uncharacterized protein n=1 Tax=Trichinella pseudospiralis TaxID=6337 RepID=A0A0V1DHA6_TRIPS|nr:hypothetical protein T4D_6869 [Trichinella pseudospiralis]
MPTLDAIYSTTTKLFPIKIRKKIFRRFSQNKPI